MDEALDETGSDSGTDEMSSFLNEALADSSSELLPAKPVEPAPAEPESPVEEPPAPAEPATPVEPEAPAFQMPEKFQGKTAEEIAQSFTELERRLGERDDERIALARQQWEAEMASYQPPMEDNVEEDVDWGADAHNTVQEFAYDDPDNAFGWAVNEAPEHLPEVLAHIRDIDPVKAEELSLEYQQWQAESMYAPLQQAQHEQLRSSAVTAAFEAFEDAYPQWDQVDEQMAAALQPYADQLQGTTDPQEAYQILDWAYNYALGQQYNTYLMQQAQTQQQAQQISAQQAQRDQLAKQGQGVSNGTPGQAPTPKPPGNTDDMLSALEGALSEQRNPLGF